MWTKTIEWPRPPLYFRQYIWKSCVYWLLTKLLVSQMAFYLLLVMTNVVCPYFSSDEGSSQVFVPFVCVSMKHHSVRCLSSESGSVLRYCLCAIKLINMRSWNQKLSKCIDLTSLPLSHAHVDTRTRTQTQRRTRTHTETHTHLPAKSRGFGSLFFKLVVNVPFQDVRIGSTDGSQGEKCC